MASLSEKFTANSIFSASVVSPERRCPPGSAHRFTSWGAASTYSCPTLEAKLSHFFFFFSFYHFQS